MTKKYTVLLKYPDYMAIDGDETYLTYVKAHSSAEAMHEAQVAAWQANGYHANKLDNGYLLEDFAVLYVFPGHVVPV